MAKRVVTRPEWLDAEGVNDIYSAGQCVSRNICDFITDEHGWRSGINGYWLYDSPEIIRELAHLHSNYLAETELFAELAETILFFYEYHGLEYDEDAAEWVPFSPDPFPTRVIVPPVKTLEGYDVASFSCGNHPECSPLSCNHLAAEIETNEHCLLPSFERAEQLLNDGRFNGSEPGPFRIVAVYSVPWS